MGTICALTVACVRPKRHVRGMIKIVRTVAIAMLNVTPLARGSALTWRERWFVPTRFKQAVVYDTYME